MPRSPSPQAPQDRRDRLRSDHDQPLSLADRLVQAVLERREEQVNLCLRHGADPNAPGFPERSFEALLPLQAACYVFDPKVLRILLDAGADPHRAGDTPRPRWEDRNRGPRSLCESTARCDGLDVLDDACAAVLQQHGWPTAPMDLNRLLLNAAKRHNPLMVQRWLDAGAEVNARATASLELTGPGGTTGNTALHLALRVEGDSRQVRPGVCLAVVQRLIQAGAVLDARNDQGYTPLLQGLRERYSADAPGAHEQAKGLHALLDAGADVTTVGPDGSALVWALESRRHTSLALRLYEEGATLVYRTPAPNPVTMMGSGSALLGALFNGSLDQVRMALMLGEDPNRPALTLPGTCSYARDGRTVHPLVRAVQRVHREPSTDDFDAVLDLMMAHGLDVLDAVAHPDWLALLHGLQPFLTEDKGPDDRLWARVHQVVRQAEIVTLRNLAQGIAPDVSHSRNRL